MIKKLTITALCATAALSGWCASNVLSLQSREITDTAIVYPESFETDVNAMLKNWYLQNYTVLDTDDKGGPVNVTDNEIIDRLSKIPTTIELPYNQIVRSYIDAYTVRRRGLVENMLGMSLYYMPMFEEALECEGIPLELKYIPIIESAMNPDAVSRAGATGLWQFMLPTARGLGMEISTLVDERRDPLVSSQMAAHYFHQLYNIYGDWSLAIAAYNCGPGNVNKALRRADGSIDPEKKDFWSIYYNLPAETRGYVPAFIAATYVMNYYNKHNISPALAKRPIITDTVHVNHRIHFNQISEILNIPIEEIRVLNPQYRKDIIPGDIRPYALRLPSQLVHAYIMSEDSIRTHNQAIYSRRGTVEPAVTVSSDGTITRDVILTHKVARNETLSKIASRYGVTQAQIKKWNKLKSSKLRYGQRLKIHTVQVVAKPKPAPEPIQNTNNDISANIEPESPDSINDSIDVTPDMEACDTTDMNVALVSPAEEVVPQPAPTAVSKKNSTKTQQKKSTLPSKSSKASTHTVKKNETLWVIAKHYGVTVSQIQKANGLNNKSKIRPGQKLKIPTK